MLVFFFLFFFWNTKLISKASGWSLFRLREPAFFVSHTFEMALNFYRPALQLSKLWHRRPTWTQISSILRAKQYNLSPESTQMLWHLICHCSEMNGCPAERLFLFVWLNWQHKNTTVTKVTLNRRSSANKDTLWNLSVLFWKAFSGTSFFKKNHLRCFFCVRGEAEADRKDI